MTFALMAGSNSVASSKCQSESGNNEGKKAFFIIFFPRLPCFKPKFENITLEGMYYSGKLQFFEAFFLNSAFHLSSLISHSGLCLGKLMSCFA